MYNVIIKDINIAIESRPWIFSPNFADKGTLAMLSLVEPKAGDKLLDLGCGSGLVAIYAAKCIGAENVFMSDIDEKAVTMARQNAAANSVSEIRSIVSDGFKDIDEKDFAWILSNPPYHADFSVPKHFIEKGFNRLKLGGSLVLVTKRELWYKNKLTAVFGGVSVKEIGGYFVFIAERRSLSYAKKN